MKVRTAWKLSRFPYAELTYRSVQSTTSSTQAGSSEGNLHKRFKAIRMSAKLNKLAFALFGTIGAAIPFLGEIFQPSPESLVSAVSLSLGISLAYVVFYSLQVLPSFSNGEPYAILSTLPMTKSDFSKIAIFSFVRTFDLIIIGTGTFQVIAIWILTGSFIATCLMAAGVLMNAVFASAIALWLSSVFYRNVTRGGRTKTAAAGRFVFLIVWGFAAMSVGFLFNFISYILPFLDSIMSGKLTQPSGLLLSSIHPFSISVLIANLVYPSLLTPNVYVRNPGVLLPLLPSIFVFSSFVAYVLISVFAGKRTMNTVSMIASGGGVRIVRVLSTNLDLRLRRPLGAYIIKDLRLASKNPSLAFLYAMPLFVVVAISVVTVQFPILGTTAIIASTIVGASFSVLICSTLLNTEGGATEYSISLPIRQTIVVAAKSIVATLTFIPVPLTLVAIALSKNVTSFYSVFIPFVELIAMGAACLAEIAFFTRRHERDGGLTQLKGYSLLGGSEVFRLFESIVISFVILLIPILIYSIVFLESASHVLAIEFMSLAAIAEFIVSTMIAKYFTDFA